MTSRTTPHISHLLAAIEDFRALEPDAGLSMLSVLLAVADKEPDNPAGVPMVDLRSQLGLPPASMSRNVAALTKDHRKGRPGHGLVVTTPDPNNRKAVLISLTPRGRAFIHRITTRMGG